jgi:hypothetical protein
MKKLLVIVFLFAFGLLAGCGNSDVSLVKDGTMNGYETTTIGKAFEASFDDTKWEGFESKKGERVVQFTGKISKDLHNSVTDEVRQQLKGLQDFQAFQAKLNLFQPAVEKFGGDKSNYFQKLNKKYGCELNRVNYAGGVIAWSPECKKEETTFQYMDEVIDAFLDESWKAGEAVEAQWIVTPDGKTFNLSHMGSAAWQGVTFDNILAAIYK